MDQVKYTALLEEVFAPWLAENVLGQPIIVCKTIPQSTKLNLYCNILCFGWQLAVHRAQSPDLNPIETVHGTYGHTLPRVCTPLKSRVEESSP